MTKNLVRELRSYDKHNHRGKYAVLCHKAADHLERLLDGLEMITQFGQDAHEYQEDCYCGFCCAQRVAKRLLKGKTGQGQPVGKKDAP